MNDDKAKQWAEQLIKDMESRANTKILRLVREAEVVKPGEIRRAMEAAVSTSFLSSGHEDDRDVVEWKVKVYFTRRVVEVLKSAKNGDEVVAGLKTVFTEVDYMESRTGGYAEWYINKEFVSQLNLKKRTRWNIPNLIDDEVYEGENVSIQQLAEMWDSPISTVHTHVKNMLAIVAEQHKEQTGSTKGEKELLKQYAIKGGEGRKAGEYSITPKGIEAYKKCEIGCYGKLVSPEDTSRNDAMEILGVCSRRLKELIEGLYATLREEEWHKKARGVDRDKFYEEYLYLGRDPGIGLRKFFTPKGMEILTELEKQTGTKRVEISKIASDNRLDLEDMTFAFYLLRGRMSGEMLSREVYSQDDVDDYMRSVFYDYYPDKRSISKYEVPKLVTLTKELKANESLHEQFINASKMRDFLVPGIDRAAFNEKCRQIYDNLFESRKAELSCRKEARMEIDSYFRFFNGSWLINYAGYQSLKPIFEEMARNRAEIRAISRRDPQTSAALKSTSAPQIEKA